MKLYRFSPIKSKEELFEAMEYIHIACHKLCKQSFGKYLSVVKNIGVFCHYDEEYKRVSKIQKDLTDTTSNVDDKYFRLHNPIIIQAKNDIPKTIYTHLYVRKPDPYRSQVGDLDFYLEPVAYNSLKKEMLIGKKITGARVFERGTLDMIELYNPDNDVLGYIRPVVMPV